MNRGAILARMIVFFIVSSGLLYGCANTDGGTAGDGDHLTLETAVGAGKSTGTEYESETIPASGADAGFGAETKAGADAGAEAGEGAGSGAAGGAPAEAAPGKYAPAFFSFSGGTGRVEITCPEVTVGGRAESGAEAVLVFSSPHYEWVKAGGETYFPANAEEAGRETSVFRIPVLLDGKTRISALTTAMSEPHEIEYSIFISLDAETAGPGGTDQGTENLKGAGGEAGEREKPEPGEPDPSHVPPDLPGLAFVSEKELAYAEAFAIYTYRIEGNGDGGSGESGENLASVGAAVMSGGLTASDDASELSRGLSASDGVSQGSGEIPSSDGAPGALPGEALRLIEVFGSGGGRYLLAPEELELPEELRAALRRDGIKTLRTPVEDLYVAATSSMALFDAAGALDRVKYTGTDVKGWYIEAPRRALEAGSMIYAGKYSAPDYELLAASSCGLAVESTMILHAPEVREKLEELGIPVFIDNSSSESHPMGRTEWVRLYGVLTGHEEEADAFFAEQLEAFAETEDYADTGKTAAFFSITSGGNVVVRAADDYIPRMIGLAGGRYVFSDLTRGSGSGASVRLSMEEFYNAAKDADYLIYNATIGQPAGSVRELCSRLSLLSEFRAVREGRVWQVRGSLYQSPDIAPRMISDLHGMFTGDGGSEMVFLEPVAE